MKVAVPICRGRISPVLDVARRLLLFDVEHGAIISQMEQVLHHPDPAASMTRLGVSVLVCGAISRPLQARLRAAGVEVIAEVCGPVKIVLRAYLDGTLDEQKFAMPGCRRRRGEAGRRSWRRGRVPARPGSTE